MTEGPSTGGVRRYDLGVPDATEDRSPAEEFLIVEYTDARVHYRHLETARSQYLGFFFVITLGAISVGLPLVAAGSLSTRTQVLVIAGFLFAYSAITATILVAVVRTGEVLHHLESVFQYVRDVYPSGRRSSLLDGLPATGRIPHPASRRLEFQVQRTAEQLMVFFMCLAAFLQAVAFAVSLSDGLGLWTVLSIGALAILAAALVIAIALLRIGGRTKSEGRRD